jgi:hypothetical protein
VRMQSLSVASGSTVSLAASMELDGELVLTGGARMALSGNASSLTVQRLDAGANSTVTVGEGASVRIRGNLTSAGGSFRITQGNLTIEGSVAFDNDTSLELGSGGGMEIQGNMGFRGILTYLFALLTSSSNRQARVEGAQVATSVPVGTKSLESGPVISYGSSSGEFSAVNVVVPTGACEQVSQVAPVYGGSSMSIVVLVSPTPQCDATGQVVGQEGLSAGAIVGIAVAAVVVAVAVMVAIVLVARHVRLKRSESIFRAREASRANNEARLSVMTTTSNLSTVPT